LQPEFKIMRSRNRSNGNYQWLNTKSYGMPHGLALGGSVESFRLFITDTFENCVASESCLTFEGGSLLPEAGPPPANPSDSNPTFAPLVSKNNFEIDHIEVYACGGEKFIQSGMKALEKDREIRDENIQKARQVDKAQFFNNAFDQEFLLSATFAHKTQTAENSEIP
jgi:TLD